MKKLVLLCALSLAFFPVQLTQGAEPTGSISGTVADPSGAAVPGAKITATNADTGGTRQTTTSGDGRYALLWLRVGSYNLTVAASGFQPSVHTGTTGRADHTRTVPISLVC